MRLRMVGLALSASVFFAPALADDTVKIGYIDPLSGGGASIGEVGLKHFQYLADEINAAATEDPFPWVMMRTPWSAAFCA